MYFILILPVSLLFSCLEDLITKISVPANPAHGRIVILRAVPCKEVLKERASLGGIFEVYVCTAYSQYRMSRIAARVRKRLNAER
jgi:hypothetical protein